MAESRYSQDEVNAILSRAIKHEHGRGELSHSDLLAAAREVGISTDVLEKAVSEVRVERQRTGEIAQLRQHQWRNFFRHLFVFLVVNGMLFALNRLTTPNFQWSLFPVFCWGIALLFHFMAVIAPNSQRLERRLERQRERERRRQMRKRIRDNASQFEHDLGEGISTLLQAAAQRISGDSSRRGYPGSQRQRVDDAPPTETDASDAPQRGFGDAKEPGRERGGNQHR